MDWETDFITTEEFAKFIYVKGKELGKFERKIQKHISEEISHFNEAYRLGLWPTYFVKVDKKKKIIDTYVCAGATTPENVIRIALAPKTPSPEDIKLANKYKKDLKK